jgi:hypothetical protein
LQELSAELLQKLKNLEVSKYPAAKMYTVPHFYIRSAAMRRVLPQIVIAMLMPTMALAADAAGTWKGSISTIVGISECTIIIKAEGENISGTVRMDVIGADITNGRIKGDQVSFTVNVDFGTLTYEGTVSGDELKFIVSAPDGSYAPTNCKRKK